MWKLEVRVRVFSSIYVHITITITTNTLITITTNTLITITTNTLITITNTLITISEAVFFTEPGPYGFYWARGSASSTNPSSLSFQSWDCRHVLSHLAVAHSVCMVDSLPTEHLSSLELLSLCS